MNNKLDKYRQSKPIEELWRKALKAKRYKQKLWTVEEIDWAKASAKEAMEILSDHNKPLDLTGKSDGQKSD